MFCRLFIKTDSLILVHLLSPALSFFLLPFFRAVTVNQAVLHDVCASVCTHICVRACVEVCTCGETLILFDGASNTCDKCGAGEVQEEKQRPVPLQLRASLCLCIKNSDLFDWMQGVAVVPCYPYIGACGGKSTTVQ